MCSVQWMVLSLDLQLILRPGNSPLVEQLAHMTLCIVT